MVAALRGPDGKQWLAALHKEVRSHAKHNTLGPKLSQAPPGFITVPFAALPQVKRNGIKKARGVMRGYLMMQGQHFNETFAPVPIVDTIRLLLAIATAKDWQIKQGDINTAFLCSEMDHKVYARVPDWFDEATTLENIPTTTSIREVLKGIPGMPQCSRLFNNKAKATFKALGLSQSKADPALFFNTQLSIYLVAWVDDLFLFFPTSSTESATTLWKNLQAAFDLGPWDDINDCLGCVVHRDRERRCMHIEQSNLPLHAQPWQATHCCTQASYSILGGYSYSWPLLQGSWRKERKSVWLLRRSTCRLPGYYALNAGRHFLLWQLLTNWMEF